MRNVWAIGLVAGLVGAGVVERHYMTPDDHVYVNRVKNYNGRYPFPQARVLNPKPPRPVQGEKKQPPDERTPRVIAKAPHGGEGDAEKFHAAQVTNRRLEGTK